jgi:pSer/pThr/pTyr-binding forkhead associated (FHA) protein
MHGIMIEAGDGDIIGRKNGAFANVFGRFNYISGTHCKIVKTAAGWHIQDMGSTNGTFYNGSKLAPNALYPLASGTTVKIADVELLVSYDTCEAGTARL